MVRRVRVCSAVILSFYRWEHNELNVDMIRVIAVSCFYEAGFVVERKYFFSIRGVRFH